MTATANVPWASIPSYSLFLTFVSTNALVLVNIYFFSVMFATAAAAMTAQIPTCFRMYFSFGIVHKYQEQAPYFARSESIHLVLVQKHDLPFSASAMTVRQL